MTTTVWHGSEIEAGELRIALSNNCACVFGALGVRTTTCPPHQSETTSQRFLDGLLAYRHISGRLIAEEWKDA